MSFLHPWSLTRVTLISSCLPPGPGQLQSKVAHLRQPTDELAVVPAHGLGEQATQPAAIGPQLRTQVERVVSHAWGPPHSYHRVEERGGGPITQAAPAPPHWDRLSGGQSQSTTLRQEPIATQSTGR